MSKRTPKQAAATPTHTVHATLHKVIWKGDGAWCVAALVLDDDDAGTACLDAKPFEEPTYWSKREAPRTIKTTGPLVSHTPGTHMELSGDWQQSPKGVSLVVTACRLTDGMIAPNADSKSLSMLLCHLAGVGPATAERIISYVGGDAPRLTAILNDGGKELADAGLLRGAALAALSDGWRGLKDRAGILTVLYSYGLTDGLADRVRNYYEQAGKTHQQIEALIKANPYQLAEDVKGIGFTIADGIALKIGFPADAPERRRAALLHILGEAAQGAGHTWMTTTTAMRASLDLIGQPLATEEQRKGAVEEVQVGSLSGLALPQYARAERDIARAVQERLAMPLASLPDDEEERDEGDDATRDDSDDPSDFNEG
jgi:exodeoxyribonuclease V alpha subunit